MGYDDLYGGRPPHERDSTSEQAADEIAPTALVLRERVFRFIAAAGSMGATDDEIELALGMRHQTASARRRELVLKGRIVDSGTLRKTSSGRYAHVWIVAPAKTEPIPDTTWSEEKQGDLF